MPDFQLLGSNLVLYFYIPNIYEFQSRIKKIMQTDEEVGKVAQAVPVIIYILFIIQIFSKFAIFSRYIHTILFIC